MNAITTITATPKARGLIEAGFALVAGGCEACVFLVSDFFDGFTCYFFLSRLIPRLTECEWATFSKTLRNNIGFPYGKNFEFPDNHDQYLYVIGHHAKVSFFLFFKPGLCFADRIDRPVNAYKCSIIFHLT